MGPGVAIIMRWKAAIPNNRPAIMAGNLGNNLRTMKILVNVMSAVAAGRRCLPSFERVSHSEF
jgi:hypothetical protein